MHLMRARTDPRNYKERGTYHIVARVKLHVDGFSIALPCVVFGAPSHHWHLQFYIALPLSSEKMDNGHDCVPDQSFSYRPYQLSLTWLASQ